MNNITMQSYLQFIKFALVGTSSSVVYLAVYYAFLWTSDAVFMIMLGQASAWIISVVNAFVLNRKFVFEQSNEIWWRAFGKALVGYSSSFIISALLTYVQIELLGVPTFIVPMVNLPVMGSINFVILKHWVFCTHDIVFGEEQCLELENYAVSQ